MKYCKKGVLLIGRLLDPKNDYVFKRIFGYIGNEEITKVYKADKNRRKIYRFKKDNSDIIFRKKVEKLKKYRELLYKMEY